MRIVIAIDSFKGCLTSREANQAAARGIRRVCPDAEVVDVPVSDGGEGFLDAFHSVIGGKWVTLTVSDPLMRPVTAHYLLTGSTAVIEVAQACGLTLLKEEERNPMVATSYGVGQLVADAVRRGAREVIVGLGGSGTSDSGIGMLQALKESFAQNKKGNDITVLATVRFIIASDVKNPLYGEQGAAYVFAPQKGATKEMTEQLEERARKFAEESSRQFGFDRSHDAGAGAAGGLGYAFMQYLGAKCKSGVNLLLDSIRFSELVGNADFVITGEGSANRQTLMGKLPMGILKHSGSAAVCLIAGKIEDEEELLRAGFSYVKCINPPDLSLTEAMCKVVASRNIELSMVQFLRDCRRKTKKSNRGSKAIREKL